MDKTDSLRDKTKTTFQKNSSKERLNPIQGKHAIRSRFALKNASKKDRNDIGASSSSIEKLHDSLEDQTALDSGLGSSTEQKTRVKVLI